MKLSTFIALSNSVLAIADNLVARQGSCSEDNCFRAVWGTALGPDHPLTAFKDCMNRLTTTVAIYPVTTITVIGRATTTAVVPCSLKPISSAASSVTNDASSLLEFTSPTPTPTSPGNAADRVKARQNVDLSYSETTIVGSIPAYASSNCFGSDSVYTNICSCKGVTQDTLTKLSTTLTSTTTSTLTLTASSTASCSTAYTITFSHGSSTSVTTVTMASNQDDTSTGTGTISASRASFTSSFSTTDTAMKSCTSLNITSTPSITQTTSFTSLNTTSTSPVTTASTTPTCSGIGTITCNGTCHDAKTDRLNCGRCGNVCGPNQDCKNGVCARAPCNSTCDFDQPCNPGNNLTSSCICATDESNHGVCFDKGRYQCGSADLIPCLRTEISETPGKAFPGCPVGQVCIKDLCNCNSTSAQDDEKMGICVSTDGCGDTGVTSLGPLVRIGEQEKRRRSMGMFNR